MIPPHPLESSAPHILDFYLYFFLFEFPWLLSGIWLAVTTAQTLNGLQSRQVFPLCLFACIYLQTCETCVYVCGHYEGLRCVCVRVSVTYRAIESTYRENLSNSLHSESLCPHGYTLPSSPCSFVPPAQHACPRGALLPACHCVTLILVFKQCWR